MKHFGGRRERRVDQLALFNMPNILPKGCWENKTKSYSWGRFLWSQDHGGEENELKGKRKVSRLLLPLSKTKLEQ